jgi:hypothetical protein
MEEARAAGATLHVVESSDALALLGDLVGRADRLGYFHERIHHEIMEGFRWTPEEAGRTRDGLDVATLELSAADLAGLRILRRWPILEFLRDVGGGRALESTGRKAVRASSAMGLLTVPGTDPAAYVRGGRAMQRVWLAASALDVCVHPMANLPYMFARQERGGGEGLPPAIQAEILHLRRLWSEILPVDPERGEILLFRLFRAPPPTARALRRPVDEVLTFDA